MHLLKVGFNHKSAPLEIRERFMISEEMIDKAMVKLSEQKSILENVIISTCNRTEVYAVADQVHTGRYYIKRFLSEWLNVDKEELSPYLHITESDATIEHLFRVASGLDSMVLGETQILGQVKYAFLTAQENNTTGTIFNELFKQAITFAKKAHKETTIGEHAVSVSYAAVELAKKVFGDLEKKHVVINGAGKMGELAARNIHGSGASNITVVNRTLTKAQSLADTLKGKAKSAEQLNEQLCDADILLSSTGSDSVILTKETVQAIQKKRKGRPLFLVDIALPRDLDPGIAELENVFLYDIDDLQNVVDDNLEARKEAAEKIEIMIEAEMSAFNDWVQTLGVVPVISALRKKALTIQGETMKSIERKMPDLTAREKKVLNKHTKSIVNQLLKQPITEAKELAGNDNKEEALQQFIDIFGIEEIVQEERQRQAKTHHSAKETEGKVSAPVVKNVPAQ
ncbi:glutamyl-tRNA reductase [Lentibacillus amyloliquefaciens]|uniref:Glutamyl-tRNA reductase n=1 Tax=Lentibacillus amyloliquefaciens TaxID=1472767 RepID=A0A0U3WEK4_9BACI|nr:glutamyl-tRNA reductase [Lentibacillus amyloliquefaciens]ALX48223.1 glutamyl-tRNA reductase [Lentibacillus amyloliquefaciens]